MAAIQRKLVHKQFNSPIALYSDVNVKETLDRELRQLNNGAVGWVSNVVSFWTAFLSYALRILDHSILSYLLIKIWRWFFLWDRCGDENESEMMSMCILCW